MLDRGRDVVCEILNVNLDDVGPYAKVKVSLADGTAVIRWGLDTFTYEHLRRVVSAQLEHMRIGSSYVLLLSAQTETDRSSQTSRGHIDCQLGNHWVRVTFGCSDLFLANLTWLFTVQSVAQLATLEWGHWTDAYRHLLGNAVGAGQVPNHVGDTRRLDSQPTSWLLVRRRWWSVALAIVAFGVLLAINFFVQSRRSGSVSSGQLFTTSSGSVQPGLGGHSATAVSHPSKARKPSLTVAAELDETSTHLTSYGVGESAGDTVARPSLPSLSSNVVYKVPLGEVALTFDDGPTPYTEGILAALQQYHAHATFFFIGKNALRYPDAVQDVAEDGDGIGDHSVDHHDMQKMTRDQQSQEIIGAKWDILQHVTAPIVLFRPPYESFNQTTEQLVLQNHMGLALWNRDPKDWQAHSPADVSRRVLALKASGGVFDLHDTQYTMLALPTILHSMANEHLKFVVLQPN